MDIAQVNDTFIHYNDEGPNDGVTLVFSNSLGTDLRVWNRLIAELPSDLRIIRYDKRGHGLSQSHDAPYFMGDLVKDAIGLIEHLGARDVIFVGLSIGGLIGQGVAAERPDLIRALVLCDTAAKIGTEQMWRDRMSAIKSDGIASMSEAILDRWFSPGFRNLPEVRLWREMLVRTSLDGYLGCCEAIATTDLIESTSRLNLPTLVLVGRDDGATPPDLVRETAELITGSMFEIIPKAGHLPCVEQPEDMAGRMMRFLSSNSVL